MRSFLKYVEYRQLREMDENPSPGLGDLSGPKEFGQDPMTKGSGESKEAFEDLQSSVAHAVSGPSGKKILTAMVSAIMNDPQVEDRIKNEIKGKVQSRWSNVIDLSSMGGSEAGLNSGGADSKNAAMGMDPAAGSNAVKPSAADAGY
jgi:hypothetical protein